MAIRQRRHPHDVQSRSSSYPSHPFYRIHQHISTHINPHSTLNTGRSAEAALKDRQTIGPSPSCLSRPNNHEPNLAIRSNSHVTARRRVNVKFTWSHRSAVPGFSGIVCGVLLSQVILKKGALGPTSSTNTSGVVGGRLPPKKTP